MQRFERFGEGNGMPSKDDVAKYGVPGNIVSILFLAKLNH